MTPGELEVFAKEVGETDPVVCVGGRTQWDVGGPPASGAREVSAPTGIVTYEPAEMTVRVRAGTTVLFPRGMVHMLHNTGGEEMKVVCFFAPATNLENYKMYEGVDFPD